jgi:hydroxymethylbilane synthase
VRTRALRVGTRGSALALWQTEKVCALLHAAGYATERVEVRTTGDLTQDVPLSRIGGRALFTKQIDDAMLAGRIDLAVHSLKDLPTELPEGILLGAIGQRDDPWDALVGRGPIRWAELPRGAVIATSSLRRRAQLLRARPDLRVCDIRGNVDTRLSKLDQRSEWTATLLAAAGLARLGLAHRIGERLAPEIMLPAPGQGALAVTLRTGDEATLAVAGAIHHEPTARAVRAERAFLRRLEGGCQVPVAAYAEIAEADPVRLQLRGRVVSLEGERSIEGQDSGMVRDESDAESLGTKLAERLLADGAAAILSEVRTAGAPAVSEP